MYRKTGQFQDLEQIAQKLMVDKKMMMNFLMRFKRNLTQSGLQNQN